jgi:ABC-type proline/glycine betaine transport system substrate-binding protein
MMTCDDATAITSILKEGLTEAGFTVDAFNGVMSP